MQSRQPDRKKSQAASAHDLPASRALRGILLLLPVLLLSALGAAHPRAAAADTLRVSGTGCALGTMRLLGDAYRAVRPDARIVLFPSMGSGGSIEALLAGRIDLAVIGRPLTEGERARGGREFLYARTPLVFGANRHVRTDRLTIGDIAAIYSGETVSWPDGSRVRPVLRPPNETDTSILKSISLEMKAAVERGLRREGMIVAISDQDAADAIEKVPGAFGATTLALVLSEKRRVRILAVGKVAPSIGALTGGAYPYVKTLYLVTRRYPSRAVREFLDFARSPAGIRILRKNGSEPAG